MTDYQPLSLKTFLVYCIYSGARKGTCLCYALTGLLYGPSTSAVKSQCDNAHQCRRKSDSLAEPHPRSASASGTRPLRFVGTGVVWLRQLKVKHMQGSASCSDCTEMKGCSAKIFCITVLYVAGEERLLKYPLLKCILGIYNVSGQSTLQPAIVLSK